MIRVHISADEIARAGAEKGADMSTPLVLQRFVLQRLQSEDVPIRGLSFVVGLEKGTLTWRRDAAGGWVFTWSAI